LRGKTKNQGGDAWNIEVLGKQREFGVKPTEVKIRPNTSGGPLNPLQIEREDQKLG